MNLESQRLSNSKPSLSGQLLPDLTVRRDQPTRFETGPTSKGNTEVISPYNSDHCLTSAVIYPQDSATLRESNVVRYERNPMIYNPSLGKNRGVRKSCTRAIKQLIQLQNSKNEIRCYRKRKRNQRYDR